MFSDAPNSAHCSIHHTVEVFSQQQSEISTRNSDYAGEIVFPHLTSEKGRDN